jgi:hypothetical protein
MLKKLICLGIAIMMLFSLAACETKEKITGTFFSLQEAYDQGFLTVEDLKSIAYYQNLSYYQYIGSDDEKYTPIPKNPDVLSTETEKAIKETQADILRNGILPEKTAKEEDITILKYYGTYNTYVAVMITDAYTEYSQALRNITVAGVLFHYSDGNSILIWKQK